MSRGVIVSRGAHEGQRTYTARAAVAEAAQKDAITLYPRRQRRGEVDHGERSAVVVPRGWEGVCGVLVVSRVEEGGAAKVVLGVHRDTERYCGPRAPRPRLG